MQKSPGENSFYAPTRVIITTKQISETLFYAYKTIRHWKLQGLFFIALFIASASLAQPKNIFNLVDKPLEIPSASASNKNDLNGQGIEVGVKFQSSSSGYITGIRFYKGEGRTGTDIGRLWDPAAGTPLQASATYAGESCYGWQLVLFSTPVAIAANTTYIASCYNSAGFYAYTNSGLSSAITNTPLTALANGTSGSNGIYNYTSSPLTAPPSNSSGAATNYWIDVEFVTSLPGTDVTAPTLVGTSPTNNYTDYTITSTYKSVIVLFNEDMDPSTISGSTFELKDASNSAVTSTVYYNTLLKIAVLTPSSALTSGTFKATITGGGSGAKDRAGNALSASYSWYFSVTSRPNLIFDENFEGPCPWNEFITDQDAGHPWSRQQSNDITAREGLHSYRGEVRSGNDGLVSSGWRSEIKPDGITDDGDKWYGVSFQVTEPQTSGIFTGTSETSLFQWHPISSMGSGTVWLGSSAGKWSLQTNPTGTNVIAYHFSSVDITADVWHDIVFHIDWTNGIVQVWIDGTLLWDLADNVNGEDLDFRDGGRYLKVGMNRLTTGGGAPIDTQVLYYDNLRIGNGSASYCDVAPRPQNDEATGAITLIIGATCTGAIYNNNCATKSRGEGLSNLDPCSGGTEAPVWFKFTAPASGAVRISTDVGSGNTFGNSKVGLFGAGNVSDYSSFSIISCDDDGGSSLSSGNMSVVYATGLTPSATYYVAVDKYSSGTATGTFCITVDELTSSMLATSNTCSSTYQTPTANSNTTYTGWQPLIDASSKLIALVRNPAGGAVDAYTVSQNINASSVRQDATSGLYYLDRNYKINNSTATNVEVQFFFLNSELTALQGVDAAVTLANLGVTRQTGTTCYNDFGTSNGTNSHLPQSGNGTVNGVSWINVTTPSFSNFYLHTTKAEVSVKAFLQGAYNAGAARHKDVTSTWASVLNANALSQPYNVAAFGSYAGTESVSSSFFASNSGSTTDIVDWVLLELKNSSGVLVSRRAAFIREDGKVVDLDGTSSVTFVGLTSGNYYITIRHRNHLGISTENLITINSSMLGVAPISTYTFDYSTETDLNIFGDSLAYLIVSNNLMICGNANSNSNVRYAGPSNDPASILVYLGGSPGAVVTNVYSSNDVNMDGTVRYAGPNNDPGFLLANALGSSPGAVIFEQKR